MNQKTVFFKKTEIKYLSVLLLLILGLTAVYYGNRRPGVSALVYRHGELLATLDLRDKTARTFYYKGITVQSEGGKVRVIQADCPDQICVKTGSISQVGQVIVCVPQGIVIKISGTAVDVVISNE